jgi:hypothetical protein
MRKFIAIVLICGFTPIAPMRAAEVPSPTVNTNDNSDLNQAKRRWEQDLADTKSTRTTLFVLGTGGILGGIILYARGNS